MVRLFPSVGPVKPVQTLIVSKLSSIMNLHFSCKPWCTHNRAPDSERAGSDYLVTCMFCHRGLSSQISWIVPCVLDYQSKNEDHKVRCVNNSSLFNISYTAFFNCSGKSQPVNSSGKAISSRKIITGKCHYGEQANISLWGLGVNKCNHVFQIFILCGLNWD